MKRIVCLIALVVALGAFPAVGKADTLVFIGTLTGAQEVPPVASPGIGFAVVTFDTVAHTLTVSVTFSGLVSPTAVSHIHCCAPPGTNAGVATPVPTFPGFPAGVQDGSYTNTFDLTNISSFNPAFITAQGGTVFGAEAALLAGLLNGTAYFNIHTVMFPGGEIRGQLHLVPEPGTLLLFGTGIAGAIGLIRRRRKT